MKKIVIGLGLIALAGYLLIGGSFSIQQFGIPTWLLICIVGFSFGTIQNLLHRNWKLSYMCGVITFVLLNTHFAWLKVSNGIIIFAAILAGVGLQFIFSPKQSAMIINMNDYQGEKKKPYREKNKKVDVVFGSNTRYVNGDVREIGGDVVFGSASFYFDNANLPLGEATFVGDAVFSSIKLYIPKDWAVEFMANRVFSSVKIEPNHSLATKKLYVQGEYVFSSLEIFYIN